MKLHFIKILVITCIISLSLGIIAVKAEEQKPRVGQLKAKAENLIEKNREIRNIKLEDRNARADERKSRIEDREERMASTSRVREDFRASTTMMFKELKDKKREIEKKMRVDVFDIRKNALVKELTKTLSNLGNHRTRIVEFMTRGETSGRDMTKAKAQLVIADEKLAKAKLAVDALSAFQYTTSNTGTASSTSDIELMKPRKIGDEAIKAVKEARDSLKKVVEEIAHAMGRGEERRDKTQTATSTATTTATQN